MDKEDQVKFPRVQNRSRLEQADETAMSKASSSAFAPNRKYSLDNGTLQDIQKSRFIGIGMNTVGSGPKQFLTPKNIDAGSHHSGSNRNFTLNSTRLLNSDRKVGEITDKQHDMFWGKVMADDTKKHLRQIDQRKMERRQNNATV